MFLKIGVLPNHPLLIISGNQPTIFWAPHFEKHPNKLFSNKISKAFHWLTQASKQHRTSVASGSIDSWKRRSFASNRSRDVHDMSRSELISQIFEALCGHDSQLTESDFKHYAVLTGFDGDESDWQTQFASICKLYGWKTRDSEGFISFAQFQEFLSDEEENTEEELREVLLALNQREDKELNAGKNIPQNWGRRSVILQLQEDEASNLDRSQLIDAIFTLLDVKKDNVLHSTELQDYAMFTGFDGTDEEWQEQYQEMCSSFGWDGARGISRDQFEDLVGDSSETSDEELRRILLNHST
eukprot:Skav222600  [mRNA]  locus=scaffold5038:1663:2559:+ [translate_table: standard]